MPSDTLHTTEAETREILSLLDHPANAKLSELTLRTLTVMLRNGDTQGVINFLRVDVT